MQNDINNNLTNNDEIDFSYYLSVLLKHIWLIIGFVIIGILAAVCVNLFMQPQFKAVTLLMIDRENAGKIDTTSFGSWASDEDYYRTQYKLLESRTLLEKVHKDMKLEQYPEFANPNGWAKLKSHLKIVPVTRSRLVNLEFVSYDNVLATKIVNNIAKIFVEENVTNRVSIAQEVISALESTEKSQKQQELLNSMPQVVNSDFIKNLKNQEISLQNQYAKLISKYTVQHPEIISLQNQLDAIKSKIDLETRRLIQSIKIELSGQFSGNNIRIIDEAIIPQYPYKPNKLLNLLIGIVVGFIIGILFAFIFDFLDKTIKTPEDLKEKLNLPFLGVVPFNKKQKIEYEMMLEDSANNLFAEQIRNIRTMLNFTLTDDKSHSFLIASSFQSEGKSYLSSNLAIAMAQTNKKVLIIDGDLRRSKLHKIFRLSNEKGLSNIWLKDKKISDFEYNVQKTDIENLSVITSGTRPPNPSELLNTPTLNQFIKWAETNYDIVIVDCPAVMPVSDTLIWGTYVDEAIFVIKQGATNVNVALSAMERMQKAGIKILGGVISQYKFQTLSYSKYGYYKNYSYYHYNDEKKK